MNNIKVSIMCFKCGKPAEYLKDLSSNNVFYIEYYCKDCFFKVKKEGFK